MSSKNLISELEFERTSTQKLLERLPEDKLSWKPHPKAFTLGQLAYHVATIPGRIARLAKEGTTTAEVLTDHPFCTSKKEILKSFDSKFNEAISILEQVDDAWDASNWTCTLGDREIINWPRPVLLRFLMLNHWYHHRGELVTYLRTLDILIPSIYGPSADENPFV
jgi:uncharacterized damage-inducible protein DinB